MDGTADNPFPWFSINDPVPAVDPADLRSMWMMQRGIQASVSGQVATDVRLFERACSPGADVARTIGRALTLAARQRACRCGVQGGCDFSDEENVCWCPPTRTPV